jgi:hypothetical protein
MQNVPQSRMSMAETWLSTWEPVWGEKEAVALDNLFVKNGKK